nr:MAG TPA: hypothetical protein [Caudoviricetes sp.]
MAGRIQGIMVKRSKIFLCCHVDLNPSSLHND